MSTRPNTLKYELFYSEIFSMDCSNNSQNHPEAHSEKNVVTYLPQILFAWGLIPHSKLEQLTATTCF